MNQTQNDETGLSAKMALCLAAMTLVGIDGEFAKEELEKLRTLIHSDETEFLRAFSFYNEHSIDVCMKVIAARLNEEQKQIVYRVLYDLAHSDQDLAKSEEDLLKQYAAAFGLANNFIAWVKTKRDKNYSLELFD
jgi:Tellurite resistance protein TerB.